MKKAIAVIAAALALVAVGAFALGFAVGGAYGPGPAVPVVVEFGFHGLIIDALPEPSSGKEVWL